MANANISASKVSITLGDMREKEEIAPILGLQADDPFEIVSTDGDLTMVHYREDADISIYATLRGVVVDKKARKIVAYSLPYPTRHISNCIPVNGNNVVLGDVEMNVDKVKFKIGYEGTLVTVFKHGGKVYRTTRKRLDFSKSRWGKSKTFGEMYEQNGGPKDEELFDPNKDYSPYCHYFILVDPGVLICTKDQVFSPYVVYLGNKSMYSVKGCPYPSESVDFDLHIPSIREKEGKEGKLNSPREITLDEANKHLLFGFYQEFECPNLDARLLPGEFVIVENVDDGISYRVESVSYAWRSEMRNNNPNLLHRFFELLDHAYLKNDEEGVNKYIQTFPILTPYDQSSLEKTLPMVIWPQSDAPFPISKDDKLYNIWQCFLMSVPLVRQKEVFGFYNILLERRNELVAWLIERSENIESLDLSAYSKRAQDILIKTRQFATDNFKKRKNIDFKTGLEKDIPTMIRENIFNFISKERGSSLYRLIREMNNFKNPRTTSEDKNEM